MEASGATREGTRTERTTRPKMGLTFEQDRDAAMQCFDALRVSGFDNLALITLSPDDGSAYAVEAYSSPVDTPGETWWAKAQIDDLGRIAEEAGADLWVTCRHDVSGGRMVARFT